MSRKLTVILLVMLVLVGAMSLKTVVVAHSDGTAVAAFSAAPVPPPQWGGAPVPPPQWGGAPVPPVQ
jgi:hypothetical protein